MYAKLEHPIAENLKRLNITLINPPAPAASYVSYTYHSRTGLLIVAGQAPVNDEGKIAFVGCAGRELEVSQVQEATRLCAINILKQLYTACLHDWKNFEMCLEVQGFIRSSENFSKQPECLNGCSDLFVEVLGEYGRHARSVAGVSELRGGAVAIVTAKFMLVPGLLQD